jgi:DNA replication and repair protein RecF
VRRKLIDTFLSQYDRTYLDALMSYYKVLEQRNSLLKQIAERPDTDKSSLDFYDLKLEEFGAYIYKQRKQLFEALQPVFSKYYTKISDNAEQVSWRYDSQLNSTAWKELFRQRREKDLIVQRTTGGIHRDDLEFQINDDKIRKFGSQGQQKSFLIALKLALYEIVANQSSSKPILLIDDIFDKLDGYRMNRLIEVLQDDVFGQIFITDTDISRINVSFDVFHAYVQVFMLDKSLADN